jgi:AraC-like DNA-binding protein/quercetin dioxygenase-like cupin family protein
LRAEVVQYIPMLTHAARISRCKRTPILFPDPAVPVVAYTRSIGPVGRFHAHTDEDWELCYIASGTADYRVGTDEFQLQAGDLLVIGPDDPHVCLGWHGERVVAIFRRSLLRKTNLAVRCGRTLGLEVAGVRIPSRTQVVPWRRTAVEYLLDRLQEESFGGQRAKHSMCVALLAQLLLELARSENERSETSSAVPDTSARRMVERLAAIVQVDLANRWTLAELVKRSGYSSTQLSVLFHRATGLSPCQWISQERVHRACQLLAHTDKTAMQIASEVGFGTRSQFHRVFRQVTGTTPERYRSALRHETQP